MLKFILNHMISYLDRCFDPSEVQVYNIKGENIFQGDFGAQIPIFRPIQG